jgi:hypothetical protein
MDDLILAALLMEANQRFNKRHWRNYQSTQVTFDYNYEV